MLDITMQQSMIGASSVIIYREAHAVVIRHPGQLPNRFRNVPFTDCNLLAKRCADLGFKLQHKNACVERWNKCSETVTS